VDMGTVRDIVQILRGDGFDAPPDGGYACMHECMTDVFVHIATKYQVA